MNSGVFNILAVQKCHHYCSHRCRIVRFEPAWGNLEKAADWEWSYHEVISITLIVIGVRYGNNYLIHWTFTYAVAPLRLSLHPPSESFRSQPGYVAGMHKRWDEAHEELESRCGASALHEKKTITMFGIQTGSPAVCSPRLFHRTVVAFGSLSIYYGFVPQALALIIGLDDLYCGFGLW